MTGNLISEYLDRRHKDLSPRSLVEYERDLNRFGHWLQSHDKDFLSATKQDISKYIDTVPVGKRSTRRKFSCIKTFYSYLWENDLVKFNPAEKLTKRIRIPKRSPKVLTADQLDLLFKACRDILTETIVKTFYYTGIRLDELVTLETTKVNLNDRTLTVIGKGNKERDVRFPGTLVPLLKSYISWRQESVTLDEGKFFIYKGEPISRFNVEYIFTKLMRVLKFHVRPHLLRHTFASNALANGMTLPEVQELLGHENVATTSIYVHITIGTKKSYDRAFQ